MFDQQNQAAETSSEAAAQIAKLYRQIGQPKVERNFLVNRSARLRFQQAIDRHRHIRKGQWRDVPGG
jgi:hypothetical protein